MLTLETSNLGNVDSQHGLSTEEMETGADRIADLLEKIEARKQDFYKVIDDENTVTTVLELATKLKGEYDDIVVLGIGGSSLGTICLQQSLTHLFENQIDAREHPRLHVIDNIDPGLLRELNDIIDLSRTLFIPVTKSGGTPETLAMYMHFRQLCDNKGLDPRAHFVFITDPEKGLLRKTANEEGITALDVPPDVGGRFSVQTPVGLFPASLIGIDIKQLLKGMQDMRDCFLSTDFAKNLPFQLATMQHALGQKGKVMNVVMPYAQKLIRFADWYRQLLAESIGKKLNDAGEIVNIGLTPINALGATDQHSQNQLYNEGPNDKFFILIDVDDLGPKLTIPNLYPGEESVDYLDGIDFAKLLHTEKKGTEASLTQNDRPNITIRIEKINAYTLGQLFMLFEGATAFLGELYGINAFDQPGVELSKNLTKEMLRKQA